MSVTPLGNVTFINQNAPVVSQTHANSQARFDLQNLIAAEAASEKMEEVAALRPAEETYKIDPQNQHEKQKNQTAQQQSDESERDDKNLDESLQDEAQMQGEEYHLDIKI